MLIGVIVELGIAALWAASVSQGGDKRDMGKQREGLERNRPEHRGFLIEEGVLCGGHLSGHT